MKLKGAVFNDGKTAKLRINKILYDFYLANYCYFCRDSYSYKDFHILIDCNKEKMIEF
mgnify:CR=1 FL=1